MCTVSVVSDYVRERVPLQRWTPQIFGEYREIIRRLTILDEKLGQPHCEDPAKVAWMKQVEERLAALEGK